MEGKRLFQKLRVKNLLSFGEEGETIDLQPLNVLIGPNASGKSNLTEVFRLLRATPRDMQAPFREGGGISEWLWKGGSPNPIAEIEATVNYPQGRSPLRYLMRFTSVAGVQSGLVDEAIENAGPSTPDEGDVEFYFRYRNERAVLATRVTTEVHAGRVTADMPPSIRQEEAGTDNKQSVLSQVKGPRYPEITYLADVFSNIGIYREWNLERQGPVKTAQRPDLPGDFLLENASNLGLILNNYPQRTKQLITEKLKQIYDRVDEIITKIYGGIIQVVIQEQGLSSPTPAPRLSDGTLRYLCLLTLLCHPAPPPLLCLEEPEVGLHPDVISTVAELLVEASARTQLIVTTHSDKLVSALAEAPEAIIVCERDQSGSHLRRLDPERLKKWLEKYSLGELWMMGEIGGTRW